MRRRTLPVLALAALTMGAAACGDDEDSSDSTQAAANAAASTTVGAAAGSPTSDAGSSTSTDEQDDAPAEDVTVRLGYFPNITHAPALVGIHRNLFDEALAPGSIEPVPFNAGPEAVEALFSGAIDASFIGPNPAINAFAQSEGEAIRIVSGTTSGGAFLVVKPEITTVEQLRGEEVATPQLGNTQDVALRSWLQENGLETDETGGGDVSIIPQANADTLTAFLEGDIAGAWVPEPWATRLIQEGGGSVLVDERDLWPDGKYVTTHLIVATDFLEDHPQAVKALIEGLAESIDAIEADPAAARADANAEIELATGRPLTQEVIDASWENLTFTLDPVASSLKVGADHAVSVGLLEEVDLTGIYDLTFLNEVLADRGEPEVTG